MATGADHYPTSAQTLTVRVTNVDSSDVTLLARLYPVQGQATPATILTYFR